MGRASADRWTPALVAATFIGLLPFVHGDVAWFDGGHLTAAGAGLGVPHATGFPLLALFGYGASLLPLGPVAFKVSLVSALAVAGAVGCVFQIARAHDARPAAAALGALFFPAVLAVWVHATMVEVYALNAFAIALLARLLLVDAPRWRVAALITGLGLGAHVTFVLLAAVLWGVALTAARRWRQLPRLLPWGVVGGLVIAYLPVAAGREPWVNMGDPSTAERLWQHLTAAGIRDAYVGEMGQGGWADVVRWADNAGGAAFLAAALVGVGALAWVGPRRIAAAVALGLVADLLFSALGNPMGQADLQTGAPGALMLSLGLAVGLGRLAGEATAARWPQHARALGMAALGLGIAMVATAGAARLDDRAGDRLAGRYGRVALTEAEPGATVLVTSDHLAGQALYLQSVEGLRPDSLVLVRQHVFDDHATAAAFARHGRSLPAVVASIEASQEQDKVAALVRAERQRRPVWWELGDGRFDPAAAPHLRPHGVLYRFAADAQAAGRPLGPVASVAGLLFARLSINDTPTSRSRRVFSDVARHRGVWHLLRGEVGPGSAALEQAVTLDAQSAPALLNLAAARRRQGRLPEALPLLERALAIDPGYARARRNLLAYRAELAHR